MFVGCEVESDEKSVILVLDNPCPRPRARPRPHPRAAVSWEVALRPKP